MNFNKDALKKTVKKSKRENEIANDQSITKILLVGNPNAGKSTLFNRLTHGHAKVGNWHGVTVGTLEKDTLLFNKKVRILDLPGIYSLDGMSMEEKGAVQSIRSCPDAFLLFVCECGALPRCLSLFQTLARGRKCALVLTKKKMFLKKGGAIDQKTLEQSLGIPVIDSEQCKTADLKRLILNALLLPQKDMGSLQGFRPQREELSRIEKLLLSGAFCVFLFLGLLLASFYLTFAPGMLGDFLKTCIEKFFSETLAAYAGKISSPVVRGFLIDGLLNSLGSVFCFLPQIALLFLFLLCMEESGFLSRLAMHTDGIFSKVGLSGRAVFSLLMGFGCSAAAILTTRGLDNKQIQRRVILCLPYISCSAKLPVYLTLSASFFSNPFFAVVLLYALGVGISFAVALFMKKNAPPFVMELAPLQIPNPVFIAKALFFQIKQFIIKLATVILAFFLASWLLSSFTWNFAYCKIDESMLADICGGLKFLFAPIGMNDWKIAYSAFSGLIAKENVAATIAMFYGSFPYSAASAFAFSIFILACSPCVSAIAASARELGIKSALINALLQTVSALLLSYFVYFLMTGGGVYLALALIPAFALLLVGKNKVEKFSRKRRKFAQKLHR